jgi:hypothetical protein
MKTLILLNILMMLGIRPAHAQCDSIRRNQYADSVAKYRAIVDYYDTYRHIIVWGDDSVSYVGKMNYAAAKYVRLLDKINRKIAAKKDSLQAAKTKQYLEAKYNIKLP